MKVSSREKLLLILIIVFGVLLVGKSLVEGYELTESTPMGEKAFYEWVLDQQAETYTGGQYDTGVLSIKVISIKERSQEDGDFYVAKSRKYLLKVIPFSDVYIKEEKGLFTEEK